MGWTDDRALKRIARRLSGVLGPEEEPIDFDICTVLVPRLGRMRAHVVATSRRIVVLTPAGAVVRNYDELTKLHADRRVVLLSSLWEDQIALEAVHGRLRQSFVETMLRVAEEHVPERVARHIASWVINSARFVVIQRRGQPPAILFQLEKDQPEGSALMDAMMSQEAYNVLAEHVGAPIVESRITPMYAITWEPPLSSRS